ncbi:MAG: arsenic metallochaperone ArsD family protein [Pelistega sp.]|nr:arsenic metallochaperone ArsD family protein [Pelistega sp.]
MITVQVFDSASCCGNSAVKDFSTNVNWAKENGAKIEQYNINDQASAFESNAVVKNFIDTSGKDALPLFLVNGEIALSGRYPTRDELVDLAGLSYDEIEEAVSAGCCSGGKCA